MSGPPPLLFLHGLGGNRSNWARQLQTFADERTVLAWNMPGYDDAPTIEPYDFAGLAAAAVGLLDRHDVEAAVVIGHSLGGMIAQELAASHADRLAGLVLVGTSPVFGGGSRRFIEGFLADRLAPLDDGLVPADFAEATVDGLTAARLPEPVRSDAVAGMSAISADAYRRALDALVTFDRRDALADITVPTLVIGGQRDPLAPVRVQDDLAGAIDGAGLAVVPDCGHLVNLEAPAVFDALLARFLGAAA